MKKTIKLKLYRLLDRSGTLAYYKTLIRRRHVILTFHQVRRKGFPHDPFNSCPSISVDLFQQVLSYLKNHYRIVPLRYLAYNKESIQPLAAITFDDGWFDNYTTAFPVLKNMGVSATIFVTVGKIGSCQAFWQQELGVLFRAAIRDNGKNESFLRRLIGVDASILLNSDLYIETVQNWKKKNSYELKNIMTEVQSTYGSENKKRWFLSEKEIQRMSQYGIEFGSHTINHLILPNEKESVIQTELLDSKRKLEEIIGKRVDMISYPNGSTTKNIILLAYSLGYRIGCLVRLAPIGKRDDLMRLPRIDSDWDLLVDENGRLNESTFLCECNKWTL